MMKIAVILMGARTNPPPGFKTKIFRIYGFPQAF